MHPGLGGGVQVDHQGVLREDMVEIGLGFGQAREKTGVAV